MTPTASSISTRCISGKHFYAFDLLALNGDDLRDLPLLMRKANLARLLARRLDGIFLSDFEQGESGRAPPNRNLM